ncbi:NAD-dependent succinate-semialdehyde dehydrogenase [Spongiibacter tropicus]|uniref:NAD-dependent succinate-semialdehyde dehydrogenase n=1 Tax=Spongiibacter tropicus TaxID=454602 RepID=UPI0024E21FE6|nr:NAD-dependent succinate-semialdehyde dehydrogenase [Spongiibacter tropicus]
MLIARNPMNGEIIAEYPALTPTQMHERIGDADRAFDSWQSSTFEDRAKVLKAVARELRADKDRLAELMAIEMGKPIKEGVPEVEKAAWCAEFYADNAEQFLSTETLASDASNSYVCYQPLGTVLGILPWNAPLWLAFRFLAPALMAGNTCAMKHDPNVPASAAGIAEAFQRAGAPSDIMVNLPLETGNVEQAIRDPRIRAVSFTGSDAAGRKVAALAGAELKPAVLELGGSDPFVVLADADLEKAADIAVLSRIINAGQSCIAAKRVIVEEPVYGTFVEMLQSRLAKLRLGDPLDKGTDIGPLARADLRQNLHRQVSETIDAGAQCLLGGELPEGPGFFYPATLLTEVSETMCAFNEETFGPVMCVTRAADMEEALQLANETDYGLGAGIWTANTELAEQMALRIDAGQVAINGIVKTDPRLPSGGIKRSGYGRELGPHGIREFVNAKQLWIA